MTFLPASHCRDFRFPCENPIAPQPPSTVKCHINDMHKSYVLRSS